VRVCVLAPGEQHASVNYPLLDRKIDLLRPRCQTKVRNGYGGSCWYGPEEGEGGREGGGPRLEDRSAGRAGGREGVEKLLYN
jgi:hypothetical protein